VVTPTTDGFIDADRERILNETCIRRIEFYDETPSTNDAAARLASTIEEKDIPCLFLTNKQTAGRGRGGNAWWFGDGALAFSLLLEPARFGIERRQWPALSLTVGASVAAAVQQQSQVHDIRLKWPNDVYFAGRKGCGILNEGIANNPNRLIIGIGLNVNNSFSTAPLEVQSLGTSLIDLTGVPHCRTDLLVAILNQLSQDLAALATPPDTDPSPASQLRDRWRELCLLTGRSVTIKDGSHQHSGTCLGLDDDAALLLLTASGPQRHISGSVVEFEM